MIADGIQHDESSDGAFPELQCVSESHIIIRHSMLVNVTKSYRIQKQVNFAGDSGRCLMG